ncbi:hypothetical protein [Mycobacterium sp.]|uniref:hypothetical protein n=1 Tax=Mycobacterium sp. TaxID=1785 RepID=UPI003BAAE0A2
MRDKLDVNIEALATDAGTAEAMAVIKPGVVVPPPDAASSELDTAAVSVAAAIKELLAQVNGNDQAAAQKQATMFTTSPSVIKQQDQQAAGTYTTTPAPVREPRPAAWRRTAPPLSQLRAVSKAVAAMPRASRVSCAKRRLPDHHP